jgi:hypothetical protein
MKIETKFKVGDTVYFISDNILNKGVINEIIINVRGGVLERYEVRYLNNCYEEVSDVIEVNSLSNNTKELFDKLILDFENSEK